MLLCALLTAIASPARAVTVDGKWAIGFEETLTGIPDPSDEDSILAAIPASGLAAHWFVGNWDFEAVVGARAQIAGGSTQAAAFLSLGAHTFVFRAPRANLSVGLRLISGYGPVFNNDTGERDNSYGFSVEVPLRTLFFLSDHFAISGAVGPMLAIEPKTGNPLTGGRDALKVHLFKGGFSGGVGFAFLFG